MDKYKDALQDIQKWTELYTDLIACNTEIRAFIKRFSNHQDDVMEKLRDSDNGFKDDLILFAGYYFDTLEDGIYF